MGELQAWYRDHLSEHIQALSLDLVAAAAGASEAVEKLRRRAHQLRGSGTSFGFPEVSHSAGLVEDATDEGVVELARSLQRTLRMVSVGRSFRPRVLLVEDDPAMGALVAEALPEDRWDLVVVSRSDLAIEAVREGDLDLLIVDLALVQGRGEEVIVAARDTPGTRDTPLAVLSGTATDEARAACMALGADVFLHKPLDVGTLALTVGGLVARRLDLQRAARTDSLTGLTNRAGAGEVWSRTQGRVARGEQPPSVALLDLDHFKAVNDRHGHAVGDAVLVGLSDLIRQRLRAADVAVRWGGEELLLILSATPLEGARVATEELLAGFSQLAFEGAEGPLRCSFSAGVATASPGQSLAETVATADRRLYQAKAAGRARVVAGDDLAVTEPLDVLVVEDDLAVAERLRRTFEARRLRVLCLDRTEGVVAIVAERNPRLVVLDVQLPDGSGLDLLGRLPPEVPVLVQTSLTGDEALAEAFERGAADFLRKPWSDTELVARSVRLLR